MTIIGFRGHKNLLGSCQGLILLNVMRGYRGGSPTAVHA